MFSFEITKAFLEFGSKERCGCRFHGIARMNALLNIGYRPSYTHQPIGIAGIYEGLEGCCERSDVHAAPIGMDLVQLLVYRRRCQTPKAPCPVIFCYRQRGEVLNPLKREP